MDTMNTPLRTVNGLTAVGLWASAIVVSILGTSVAQANTVVIGDPTVGGVRYHLHYTFNSIGTLSAHTGQSLPVVTAGEHVDAGNNGIVDTIASKSFHDQGILGGTTENPIYPGTYGWTHTSRWALVDLNGLYDAGHQNIDLSITLERFGLSSDPAYDLIPGLAVWHAKEDAGNWSHRYVNGINSTNWNHWNGEGLCAPAGTCSYFPTLAQAGLDGRVWAAADDRTNPTGLANILINGLTLSEGGNNYLTIVMGGNADLASVGAAKNFLATVTVVPVPAAVWLFGSGLIGLAGLARRRMRA